MTLLLAGRRILAVEDEMLVLMNIEMALKDFGRQRYRGARAAR